MCNIVIRDRTTANVAKARKRKLQNRKLREQAYQIEATKLGISVHELLFGKVKEAQAIRDAAKTVVVFKSPKPYQPPRGSSWYDDDYWKV